MPIGYAKVSVDIGAFVADADDPDDLPDDTPLTATMTLTPMIDPSGGRPLVYNDGGVQKLKAVTDLVVQVGPYGKVNHQGRDYVKVIAPTATETNLASLQWRASFTDVRYGTSRIKLNDIYFYAVPGVDVNLAEHVNVAPNNIAVLISRGPRGFGVIGADATEDGELVLMYESQDGPVESDPIPIPIGMDQTTADATYAPQVHTAVLTRDGAGRITSAVENGVTVTYTRDSAGRIATETKNGKTTTYTRDSSGRVASWSTV